MKKKTLKRLAAAGMTLALAAAPFAALAQGNGAGNARTPAVYESAAKSGYGAAVKNDAVWDGSIADAFAGGSGTQSDPFLIADGSQLAYLAKCVNEGTTFEGQYIKLTGDIRLNATSNWTSWINGAFADNEWTPIGGAGSVFGGTFDGAGFTVYGIYIDETGTGDEKSYKGLFGNVNDAVIKDVTVSEFYICGDKYIGGIAGCADSAKISGCRIGGAVVGSKITGGVVGGAKSSNLSDCVNESVKISGTENTGGIVGSIEADGRIVNCHNKGTVEGSKETGGICGDLTDCRITGSSNTGVIKGGDDATGGLSGAVRAVCNISNSYNSGSVSGSRALGGLIGNVHYNGNVGITNCFNSGAVAVGELAGGIIGYVDWCAVSFTTSYNLNGGQFVGNDPSHNTSANCYIAYKSYTGTETDAVSLTDVQMKDASNYAGFDFESVWTMDGNPDYPYPELAEMPYEGEYGLIVPKPEGYIVWDFDSDEAMKDWTFRDADEDGYGWERSTKEEAYYSYSADYYMASMSSINYYSIDPDNWLISPGFAAGGELEFYIRSADAGRPNDTVSVYVSTDGEHFDTEKELESFVASGEYVKCTVDLSEYAGRMIWLGFRHYGVSGLSGVYLDTVMVSEGELLPVTPPPAEELPDTGDVDCDGKITVGDALTTLRRAMELLNLSDTQIKVADVDGDGAVTVKDALAIIRAAMDLTEL